MLIEKEPIINQIANWRSIPACDAPDSYSAYEIDVANDVIDKVIKAIDAAPTIEAEPVKRGEWIEMVFTDTGKPAGYKCSECGLGARKKFAYCHCGAKMNTKEDDQK